jgi:D-glycero-D-manno-heptose 1,7-bisphosphate phosphatase
LPDAPRGAVFLDRDGTLVEDPGYLHEPADVRLLPGVAEGLQRLAAAGWPLVLVSNQSGIARGLYGAEAFRAVNHRLEELADVRFAGAYHCPHHPEFTGPCECRKPALKLFRQAARELGLDLAASWFVGNRRGDIEPARSLGGRAILTRATARASDLEFARDTGIPAAADFLQVVSLIIAQVTRPA